MTDKLIPYNEYENKIYIPNEIFTDLRVLHGKGSSHVAFAYSYYFLISWLYRYAKYGEKVITVQLIKQMLGYSGNNKDVNYIIKKNGILDQIGYTRSDTDFPIAVEFISNDVIFTMISELDLEIQNILMAQRGKNYKIKIPLKGLWRDTESEVTGEYNGAFYQIDYTHEMTMDIFYKCMSDKRLGVHGFYLYGYLKYRCDKFGKYQVSLDRLREEVGISKNTVEKYMNNLIKCNLIKCIENGCRKIDKNFVKEANTYTII